MTDFDHTKLTRINAQPGPIDVVSVKKFSCLVSVKEIQSDSLLQIYFRHDNQPGQRTMKLQLASEDVRSFIYNELLEQLWQMPVSGRAREDTFMEVVLDHADRVANFSGWPPDTLLRLPGKVILTSLKAWGAYVHMKREGLFGLLMCLRPPSTIAFGFLARDS